MVGTGTKSESAFHEESLTPPSGREESSDGKAGEGQVKLDKHGLPLVPQPSPYSDDPLVCCGGES